MTAGDPPLDQHFRKTERLLRRPDFVRVQTTGRKFRSRRLTIAATPSLVGRTRIGITVSRKVGNSPVRSQVKRWIREIYRLHKGHWPADTDFVVIARPPAARADYAKLRDDMLRWAAERAREATAARASEQAAEPAREATAEPPASEGTDKPAGPDGEVG